MNILFVNNHPYLPQKYGGIELSTHELASTLTILGHKVSVVSDIEPHGFTYYFNRIKSRFIGKKFPKERYSNYEVRRGWMASDLSKDLHIILDDIRPEIVIVQARDALRIANKIASYGHVVYVYVRDVEFNSELGSFHSAKPVKDGEVKYISNSKFTARRLFEEFGVSSLVMNPLVLEKNYKTEISKEVVLFINPIKIKGLDVAIGLARLRPDLKFLFQESWALGENREKLMNQIKEIPNIELCTPCADMRKVYARAKVLLVPSQWEEAWGRVVIEAQISGIPVLASNQGALPETVGSGGLVVEKDADISLWLEALSKILDSDESWKIYSNAALENANRQDMQVNSILETFYLELNSRNV